MKIVITIVLAIIITNPLFAGDNIDFKMNFGDSRTLLDSNEISIPIYIEDILSIKSYTIILSYEGDINIDRIRFVPSSFLNKPLIVPIVIDDIKKTIKISVTATQKIVTRDSEGTIGELLFDRDNIPRVLKFSEVKILDGNRKIDILSNTSISSYDNQIINDQKRSQLFTGIDGVYPNPANPNTIINFSIESEGRVLINIYNVRGELVKKLVNIKLKPDNYSVTWNGTNDRGSDITSGIYFCKFDLNDKSQTVKIVLLK